MDGGGDRDGWRDADYYQRREGGGTRGRGRGRGRVQGPMEGPSSGKKKKKKLVVSSGEEEETKAPVLINITQDKPAGEYLPERSSTDTDSPRSPNPEEKAYYIQKMKEVKKKTKESRKRKSSEDASSDGH